jgi:hypothetical protein
VSSYNQIGGVINALNAGEDAATVLGAYYAQCPDDELAKAYANVARGLAVFEETPRGHLGPALRQHLQVIAAEQETRGGGHG